MLTQKKTGGLIKTNMVLAILSFILILYSTFLTRSGVLGDTSVHSFVDPGLFAYVLLLVFMATFSILGIGLLLYRLKDMQKQHKDFQYTSREFATAIGSAVIMASAVIVFIGTSWPIIAELINQPKVAIATDFYNQMHIPIAMLIGLVNATSLILSWKTTTPKTFFKKLPLPLGAGVVLTLVAILLGVHEWEFVLMVFAATFMLTVNIDVGRVIISKNAKLTGAYISHFGFALLLLGVIATSNYSLMEHVQLPFNDPKEALNGYTFTYLGKERIEKERPDIEKYHYLVKVEDADHQTVVKPILFWSDFNKRQSAFLEPGIDWTPAKDVYVSPKAIDTEGEVPTMKVAKAGPRPLPFDSSYTIHLQRFDMSGAMQSQDKNNLRLGIVVNVARDGETVVDTAIYTTFAGQEGIAGDPNARTVEPFTIPGTEYQLALWQILPDKENLSNSQALIGLADIANPATLPKEIFTVEVSVKPFINFVWVGVLFMVGGFFVSIARRSDELKNEVHRDMQRKKKLVGESTEILGAEEVAVQQPE
jgi:cytochrome c-type biogenesis protein CcmF